MLVIMFVKFYEMVRVYDTISYFLYLVVTTIKEIQHHLYIFVIFQFFFAMCFVAMEVEPDEEFDPAGDIGYGMKIFTLCWFNSLSKLKFVQYKTFAKETEPGIHKNVHIGIIYFLYFSHIMTMFTMMLNMMVAVIDEAYRQIDQYKEFYIYQFRANLNLEYFMLIKSFVNLSEYTTVIFTTELEMNQKWDSDRHMEDSELVDNLKNIIKVNSKYPGLLKFRQETENVLLI